MKSHSLPILVLTIILAVSGAEARIWTQQNSGKKIEADFVRVEGANVVLKFQGREVRVPLDQLSADDRVFIEGQGRAPSTASASSSNTAAIYLGPDRNGSISTGGSWAWDIDEPKILWRTVVAEGHSGCTIDSENRLFTQGWDKGENRETVFAIDAVTGEELWQFHNTPDRMFERHGSGATPALDGGRVYALQNSGEFVCLEAESGEVVWQTHLISDQGGMPHDWGYAGTPLITGNLVIVDAGGSNGASTIAFDKTTGQLVWKSGDFTAGYASPVPAEIRGKAAVLVFKYDQLIGLDLESGRQLLEYPKPGSIGHAIPSPILDEAGDSVFFGKEKITLGASPRQKWDIPRDGAFLNTPTLSQGHMYDVSGQHSRGPLVCIDFESGQTKWTEDSVQGPGNTFVIDNTLVVYLENGELVLGSASPDGFNMIGRHQVHRNWNNGSVSPAFKDGLLYLRGVSREGNVVTCLDFRK
ncbi:MAG: outer membrane protein assembly factor BamB [Verrucomicrobiales bacterium]|jgi:outer membrane protein assembly factor BamB